MNLPKKNQTQAADIPNPVFDNGNDAARRMTDPTVAVGLTINATVRNAGREISCNVSLHEFPLLRRLYRGLGGSVTARTDWIPALRRRFKLSHLQLQEEVARLSRLYVVPVEGGKHDIMGEVYGAVGGTRIRALRDKMIEAIKLWTALEERAMADIRASGLRYHKAEVESLIADRLTDKDLDALLRQLDPSEVAADDIDLGAIEESDLLLAPGGTAAPGGEAEGGNVPVGSIADAFAGVGTPDEDEQPATVVDDTAPLDPADLTEEDMLIANLRQDGFQAEAANQAAIVVGSYPVAEREARLKDAGFKHKQIATITKRAREYDASRTPA